MRGIKVDQIESGHRGRLKKLPKTNAEANSKQLLVRNHIFLWAIVYEQDRDLNPWPPHPEASCVARTKSYSNYVIDRQAVFV